MGTTSRLRELPRKKMVPTDRGPFSSRGVLDHLWEPSRGLLGGRLSSSSRALVGITSGAISGRARGRFFSSHIWSSRVVLDDISEALRNHIEVVYLGDMSDTFRGHGPRLFFNTDVCVCGWWWWVGGTQKVLSLLLERATNNLAWEYLCSIIYACADCFLARSRKKRPIIFWPLGHGNTYIVLYMLVLIFSCQIQRKVKISSGPSGMGLPI